ncbi:MAG: polysaccharide deacetylase family protein [Bacteroidales bacterium]
MNILSFDIEEWHLYDLYPKGGRGYFLPIINSYLDRVLDLLEEKNYKATFYCLGMIAKEYPEVIRKIAQNGHEIGCHSNKHLLIQNMTEESFRRDTRIAIDEIEQVIGSKIELYRAPSNSMNKSWHWSLDVLMEEGITCDSSIFSAGSIFKDKKLDQKFPYIVKSKSGTIKELPIGYASFLGQKLIFSGGGYFRFFPYSLIETWMHKSDYNMTYFHIRDFDKEQKRVISKRYFLSYYGVNSAYEKFEKIVSDFEFITVGEAIRSIDWEQTKVVQII